MKKGEDMRKLWKPTKVNNKGLTLLEVMITIAILGIVSVPLMNSFLVGMQANNAARRAQDAAQEAQDLAEAFKTTDIDAIVADGKVGSYSNVTVTKGSTGTYATVDHAGHYAKYTCEFGDQYKGDGNEKYYLDATLTALDLTDVPAIIDVGNVSVVKFDESYYKYDQEFKDQSYTGKQAILNVTEKNEGGGAYKFTIELNVEYTKGADKATRTILRTVKNVSSESGDAQADIYLLCNYFNQQTDSTDKVKVNYKYEGSGAEADCNVYIFEQKINNWNLRPENIEINKICGEEAQGLRIYSNIQNLKMNYFETDSGIATKSNIAIENKTVPTRKMYTLYQLDITVHQDSKSGKQVASLSTTITE